MKKILVCGSSGFIGAHLVTRLKLEGHHVTGADLEPTRFGDCKADRFVQADLRHRENCLSLMEQPFDEVYQLAADMGGAGYIFTGAHDAAIMKNSALINLNMLEACRQAGAGRVFYASSACIYPQDRQADPDGPDCEEQSAYPADPDSEYGWEKLFSERMYLAYGRNHGLSVRIARYHNVFGPRGAWKCGREKAPAAICRKVAKAPDGGEIEIWGDGQQTRSFLYVDECLEGTLRLMQSDWAGPVNIGSAERVSIAELTRMVMEISEKKLSIRYVPGPQGVRGRCSDNRLIQEKLGWAPSRPLREGMEITYHWVAAQVAGNG